MTVSLKNKGLEYLEKAREEHDFKNFMSLEWKDFALGSSDQEDLSYAMSKILSLGTQQCYKPRKKLVYALSQYLGGEYTTADGKGQIFKYLLR